jgi:hypothetical protein
MSQLVVGPGWGGKTGSCLVLYVYVVYWLGLQTQDREIDGSIPGESGFYSHSDYCFLASLAQFFQSLFSGYALFLWLVLLYGQSVLHKSSSPSCGLSKNYNFIFRLGLPDAHAHGRRAHAYAHAYAHMRICAYSVVHAKVLGITGNKSLATFLAYRNTRFRAQTPGRNIECITPGYHECLGPNRAKK